MKHDDFVRTVAGRTALTRRRADDATVATLTVLAQALGADETRDLLAQLPKRYKEAVPVSSEPVEMRPVELFARVADLLGDTTLEDAERIVRGVSETLDEAVNAGEMRDVVGTLGGEFAELFGRSPLSGAAGTPNGDRVGVPWLPEPVAAAVTSVVRTIVHVAGAAVHAAGGVAETTTRALRRRVVHHSS